ncbi:phage portal protein [Salipiger aestuarii]|uniref:phage portal protein n=1 Tax=Salipiger aestuarii TaxID=568098 RepID=UPI00123C5C38|nr:phage portal protein [Salipiger aestuarii]
MSDIKNRFRPFDTSRTGTINVSDKGKVEINFINQLQGQLAGVIREPTWTLPRLGEVYENAPLASQIVPFPEAPETDLEALARRFRGNRGRVLLRESVNVAAAGGPVPQSDWTPRDLSPDLSKAMTRESLEAARNGILSAFGVLPGLFVSQAQGPVVREAQRHLAQWTLQPLAALMAEEASEKLGTPITLDVVRPLQAFDAGGRARAFAGMVQAMAAAKEAQIDPQSVEDALRFIDWAD